MSRCPNCPLARDRRETCGSECSRSLRPQLALVGESPGFTELREGRPFSPNGATGRLLASLLRELQLGRSEVWIGNAVNCGTRTSRELDACQPACRDRLIGELKELDPSIPIVPLGTAALRSVLGNRSSILRYRGSVSKLEEGPLAGRLVIPAVHPAFALRAPAYEEVLRRDLAKALEIAENGWTDPFEHAEKVVAGSLAELEYQLPRLGAEIEFDVETTLDGPLEGLLKCFALSDGKLAILVPWSERRDGTGDFWRGKGKHAAELVTRCMEDRTTVMHNGIAFDVLVAERYGIFPSAVEDTLIAWHALHGELPKNLGFVASYYLPVPPWKSHNDVRSDLPELYVYNQRDGVYGALLWQALKRDLAAAASS